MAKSQQELRDGTSRRMQKRAGILPGQSPRRPIERCAELQGLPKDFLRDAPFTAAGKYEVIGNGVPLPMGRAIANAVKRALDPENCICNSGFGMNLSCLQHGGAA